MDVKDDADLAALLPAWRDFTAACLPGPAFDAERLRFEAGEGLKSDCLLLGAFTDDEPEVAAGGMLIRLQTDLNTDLGDAQPLLRAGHADAAVAEALLAASRERLAQIGRTRLQVNLPQSNPTPAYETFRAPTSSFTAMCSALDLSALDRDQYAEFAAPSPKNSQYRIVHWIDRCPDELAESFSAALNTMHDIPLEDLNLELSQHDVARLREGEAVIGRHGARRCVTAAVDEEGEVAGFTQSVYFPAEPATMDLWSTAVVRRHRGHRLGLRIKAAATLRILHELPEAQWVCTFNNHENEHMLAVNRQLGYQVLGGWDIYEFAC